MKVQVKGLDKLKRELDKMKRQIEEASRVEPVPVEELLPPVFMSKHTNFNSLAEMVEKSGSEPSTHEDWDVLLASEGWNTFVTMNTLFSSWESMLSQAAEDRVRERLGWNE